MAHRLTYYYDKLESILRMFRLVAHRKSQKRALQNVIAPLAFWSFDQSEMKEVPDDSLIEAVLVHGNDALRQRLVRLFSKKKVQSIWERKIVIRGNNYQFLNHKIASDLLKISNPDEYIKMAYSKYNLYDRFSSSNS